MKKTFFITGSSKGIGLQLSRSLLLQNHYVFGFSRANTLDHENFTFTNIDLSDLNKVKTVIFPEVKTNQVVLINNAASIGEIKPLAKKNPEDIVKELSLNLIAPTLFCRNFIKTYADKEKLILNISSGAATKPIGSWNTYCASKSALDMLTNVLCEEKYKDFRAISVYPGIVDTDMQTKIRNTSTKDFPLQNKFNEYYINNELIDPSHVAQKIIYLVNNHQDFLKNIVSVRDFDI